MTSSLSWSQAELMTKVARLSAEQGLRQVDIARRLNLSQATVSRLLSRARDAGILRIQVVPPVGLHVELEDALLARFGLADAVVVDGAPAGADPAQDLGMRAAGYLQATLGTEGTVGISSWSATLLAAATAMGAAVPVRPSRPRQVVQLVGGHGDPHVQAQAVRLLTLVAQAIGGEGVSLPAPGILGSASARDALMSDPALAPIVHAWSRVSVALVGIGSVDPSPLVRDSGNAWGPDEVRDLARAGAVGDICFRFFDAVGQAVVSSLDGRVVGISGEEFRAIPRRVAVAAGPSKVSAIAGAASGGWLTSLVTDVHTAEALLATP
jgi:DNA-binding transcriptional regulator LsrR (DeoR family)